jgi:hypothetical protein
LDLLGGIANLLILLANFLIRNGACISVDVTTKGLVSSFSNIFRASRRVAAKAQIPASTLCYDPWKRSRIRFFAPNRGRKNVFRHGSPANAFPKAAARTELEAPCSQGVVWTIRYGL